MCSESEVPVMILSLKEDPAMGITKPPEILLRKAVMSFRQFP